MRGAIKTRSRPVGATAWLCSSQTPKSRTLFNAPARKFRVAATNSTRHNLSCQSAGRRTRFSASRTTRSAPARRPHPPCSAVARAAACTCCRRRHLRRAQTPLPAPASCSATCLPRPAPSPRSPPTWAPTSRCREGGQPALADGPAHKHTQSRHGSQSAGRTRHARPHARLRQSHAGPARQAPVPAARNGRPAAAEHGTTDSGLQSCLLHLAGRG